MSGEYTSHRLVIPVTKALFFSKIWLLPLCLLVLSSPLAGQSLKEFRDIWVAESREFLLNNQKPLPYLQSGFHHFSRQQDNAFTEGLEGNWEKFPAVPATPVHKSKKFDPAPKFNFDETSFHSPHFLPCFTADNEELYEQGANLPRIRKPEYTSSNPLRHVFKFYGNNVTVTYDRLLALPVGQPVNREVVADFWKKFVVANSNHLVGQLIVYRNRLGLNDLGYFLLVKSCANAIYPGDEAGAALLGWALMIRSGFNVKIGFNQLGASILYPTAPKIAGVPYVKIGGSDYYIDKPVSSFPISTYAFTHGGASGVIHLQFNQSLNFQGEVLTRKIPFAWDKKTYEFNLRYNPEVLRFLEEYPQTDPELYFNAPFTFLSEESLLRQFRPILAGMKKEAGAVFLQQFVQKSFAYHPYNDLFGHDRFMFPEELLFKEESNDKGKALLYAWMISNLLNQKAALVEFPGFYSVAVSLSQPMEGDNFLVNGKSYTMADPTFENAPLGLVMKEFYQLKPLIRPLKNSRDEEYRQERIWKLAGAFGAERSGSGRDYLNDDSGNIYITGFFNEKLKPGTPAVKAPFIAKFDENNALAWMLKFHSGGRAFGLELKKLERDEFYLAGSFRGELECNGIRIQSPSSDPDLFFVQFDRQGKIAWMSKSGLDELEEDTKLFYVVRFSRSGEIQSVQLANEDERNGTTGFQRLSGEGLCYVASRYQTTGLDKESEESATKPTLLFRQNLNRMKQLGLEQTVACVASLFNSLIATGNQLNGSELVAFNPEKEEPDNRSLSNLAGIFQKIRQLKNDGGIVEVLTADAGPLKISSFTIANHAHLKIIPLDNNDLMIRIIDGVQFESGTQRANVNSFVIDLAAGNLLLDLGRDHQLISRNLKREILK